MVIKLRQEGDPVMITRSETKIKVKSFNKATLVIRMTLLVLVLVTLLGFFTFDYKGIHVFDGIVLTGQTFLTMFLEPHFSHFTFVELISKLFITIGLAILTTMLGAAISLFLALVAARNLASKTTSNIIRGIIAVIRAVPTVLWVLIFAVAAGLGSVAAVIGMSFHSIGYLVKAYSESFEEMDDGVIEALKASGATWWQIVFQAVLPSSMTYLLSWTFLRFEINFTVAVAMGAAAGAGGIGYDMFMASVFYYDLREVGIITYFMLLFAILLEVFATRLKRKLRLNA
ncbi:ABC transporter permease subunit [Paenibacillus glucanolyticus]|nr:phosphonate ABC transporter permease [Paenibacillus sp. Cedars]MPY18322.1 ABC transporter permease subunit [Paenibacillus glucanolyticus]